MVMAPPQMSGKGVDTKWWQGQADKGRQKDRPLVCLCYTDDVCPGEGKLCPEQNDVLGRGLASAGV